MKGESIEEAARRELYEETGYEFSELEYLFAFYRAPGYTTQKVHVVKAAGLVKRLEESDEWTIDVKTARLDEVPDMIRSGEIEDGKTISALLFALIERRNG